MRKVFKKIKGFFSNDKVQRSLVFVLEMISIAWFVLLGYAMGTGALLDEKSDLVIDTSVVEMSAPIDRNSPWPIMQYLKSNQYVYDESKELMLDNNKKLFDNSKDFLEAASFDEMDVDDFTGNGPNGYGRYAYLKFIVEGYDEADEWQTIYFEGATDDYIYLGTLPNGDDLELSYLSFGSSLGYNAWYDRKLYRERELYNSFYYRESLDVSMGIEMYIGFKVSADTTGVDLGEVRQSIIDNFINTFKPRVYTNTDYNGFLSDMVGGISSYGYMYGEAYGYKMGYAEGLSDGGSGDFEAGFNKGWSEGQENGFRNGKAEGYILGYDEGYDIGYQKGYDKGFPEGQASDFGFTTLLSSIFVGMGSFLAINILPGISIGAVVAVPIVFGIIYFIIGRKKE